MWTIAFDPIRNVAGCAIVQRGLGATVPSDRIDGLEWVTSPTPDMALYPCDENVLARLRAMAPRS